MTRSVTERLAELMGRHEQRLGRLVFAPALAELGARRRPLVEQLAALEPNHEDPLVAEDARLMRVGLGDRLTEIDELLDRIRRQVHGTESEAPARDEYAAQTRSSDGLRDLRPGGEGLPEVLIAVERDPAGGPVMAFDAALDARSALRGEGVRALLWQPRGPIDDRLRRACVFPLAERTSGSGAGQDEPGGLRAWLEAERVAFFGTGAAGFAIAGDKRLAKRAMLAADVAVPEHSEIEPGADAEYLAFAASHVGLPAVVKPACGPGGSVGVRLIESTAELRRAVSSASGSVLLERYVAGRELTVWVVGASPRADDQVVLAIDRRGRPIYERSVKHQAGGEAGPVSLAPPHARAVQRAAVRAHLAVEAYSYSRVDMVLADRPVVLEVNVAPRIRADSALGINAGRDQTLGQLLVGCLREAMLRTKTAEKKGLREAT